MWRWGHPRPFECRGMTQLGRGLSRLRATTHHDLIILVQGSLGRPSQYEPHRLQRSLSRCNPSRFPLPPAGFLFSMGVILVLCWSLVLVERQTHARQNGSSSCRGTGQGNTGGRATVLPTTMRAGSGQGMGTHSFVLDNPMWAMMLHFICAAKLWSIAVSIWHDARFSTEGCDASGYFFHVLERNEVSSSCCRGRRYKLRVSVRRG